MNISIGLYDLFSYLVPGILYIYIVNQFLVLFNWASIDIAKLNNVIYLTVVLVAAYVLGHLISAIFHFVWYGRRRNLRDFREKILQDLKGRSNGIEIHYNPRENPILLEILRRRDKAAMEEVERYKANSVMMRNVTNAMILYALYQFALLLKTGFQVEAIIMAILFGILGLVAYFWALRFDEWYYRAIYTQALAYGPGLKEFLENDKPYWRVPVADAHASEEDQ